MTLRRAIETAAPFGALIPASSLVLAILYVAGFAYRWSYYFNFGLQHIVYEFGLQAIFMTAIELIRPEHFLLIFLIIVLPFVGVSLVLEVLRRMAYRTDKARVSRLVAAGIRGGGLDSPVVAGAIKALVLIWTTYMVGTHLGYMTFTQHVVNSSRNPLPEVTAILNGKAGADIIALSCGGRLKEVGVIGGAAMLREIQEGFRTCTARGTTWRLLYRDRDVIVLFASEPAERITGKRPLTIILPTASGPQLILQ